jgi:hypothetical protein
VRAHGSRAHSAAPPIFGLIWAAGRVNLETFHSPDARMGAIKEEKSCDAPTTQKTI